MTYLQAEEVVGRMTWFAAQWLVTYYLGWSLAVGAIISVHFFFPSIWSSHLSFFSEGSYMIVLCSRLRRSNIRTLPSAPQLTKTSTLFAQNRTSKTSLSWAISCVFAVRVGISQMVHVVSILEVMIRLGERLFQSRDVRGAVCSGDLELESRASGVSF